jgi:hypothetical protein
MTEHAKTTFKRVLTHSAILALFIAFAVERESALFNSGHQLEAVKQNTEARHWIENTGDAVAQQGSTLPMAGFLFIEHEKNSNGSDETKARYRTENSAGGLFRIGSRSPGRDQAYDYEPNCQICGVIGDLGFSNEACGHAPEWFWWELSYGNDQNDSITPEHEGAWRKNSKTCQASLLQNASCDSAANLGRQHRGMFAVDGYSQLFVSFCQKGLAGSTGTKSVKASKIRFSKPDVAFGKNGHPALFSSSPLHCRHCSGGWQYSIGSKLQPEVALAASTLFESAL